MPESLGLYLRLSVVENLECFADLHQVTDPADRIDRAPRAVGLGQLDAVQPRRTGSTA
jgi:ABC-2 type transport system ATP-binding protein